MKKILKGPTVWRAKCHYCDCEFEYDRSDVYDFIDNGHRIRTVDCPVCQRMVRHDNSQKSNTSIEMEETMST